MRITWVTRSFLDYRIPVYKELNRLCGNQLTLIYYRDVVPERVQHKIETVLGARAIALTGEWRLSGKQSSPISDLKRKGVRIPFQPGLLRTLKDSAPDVMISDGFFQWSYATLSWRFWKKVPHVMCYEPTAHTERNAQWYRTLYRRLAAKWIDALCCNGLLCKEYAVSLGIAPEKIFLGNMAADSQGLERESRKISDEQVQELKRQWNITGPLLLYVGRLVDLKGVQQLLEAWYIAQPDLSLMLIGDGSARPALEQFCHEKRCDRVHFAGAINYDQLPIFYRAADLFIIPTLQDNWSLVVPEAMACGLPIACSKYNGCYPELVKPENGWVFDPLDQRSTVNTLQEIVDRKDDLQLMGKRSLEIVAEHTPQKAAESIYKACLKAQGKGIR